MAFTRNSNNGVGRQFLVGVIDALWPSAYPNFSDNLEHHRLGDMLNHARAVMTVNYPNSDSTSDPYVVAWAHARMLTRFEDPTRKIWLEKPTQLPMFGDDLVAGPAIELVYPYRGATITVFEESRAGLVPIDRAEAAEDGKAPIDPLVLVFDEDDLRIFASAPGAVALEVYVARGNGQRSAERRYHAP